MSGNWYGGNNRGSGGDYYDGGSGDYYNGGSGDYYSGGNYNAGQNSGGGYGGGFKNRSSNKRGYGGGGGGGGYDGNSGNYSQKRNSYGGGGGGGYDNNSQWLRGNEPSGFGGNQNDNFYGNDDNFYGNDDDGYSSSYGRNSSRQQQQQQKNPFKWYKQGGSTSTTSRNGGNYGNYSDDYFSNNRFGGGGSGAGNSMISDDLLKEIGRSYLNNYRGNNFDFYNNGGGGWSNQSMNNWGRGYTGSYYGRQFAQKQQNFPKKKKKSGAVGGGAGVSSSKEGKTKRQETRLEKFKKRQHDKRKFKNLKYLSLNLPADQSWLVFSVKHYYLDLSRIGEDEDISVANSEDSTTNINETATVTDDKSKNSDGDKTLKRRPLSSELANLKLKAYFFTYLLSKHRNSLKLLTYDTRRFLDATFVDYEDKYNYLVQEKNALINKYKVMYKRTSTQEDVAKKHSIVDEYIPHIIGDKFDEQNAPTSADYFIDDAKVNDNFVYARYYLIKQCYEYFDFKCINVYKPPTSIEQRLNFHMNNKCIPYMIVFRVQEENERFKLSEEVHGKYVKMLPEHLRKINDKINKIFYERIVRTGEQVDLNGKNVLAQKVRQDAFQPDNEFLEQFESSISLVNKIMSIIKYKFFEYCFEIDMAADRKSIVLNALIDDFVNDVYYILKNKLKYKDLIFEEMGRLEDSDIVKKEEKDGAVADEAME